MESLEGGIEMKMIKVISLAITFMVMMPVAHAEDLFDWLKSATASKGKAAEKPSDSAQLLTLEPKEAEMYPLVSNDGRNLIVTANHGKDSWVSKRATENGDPLSVVTEDDRAVDSVRWLDNDSITFFSERAGGLGLWIRNSDGQGIVRRAKELNGEFTQPILLSDGSVIAVRIEAEGKRKSSFQRKYDDFENWSIPGHRTEIVHINEHGREKVLSQGINPALSPDGQWIAFSLPVGRSYHLYMMRSNGDDLTQLTDDRSVDVQPTWSRDGKWIIFTSNRSKMDLRHPKKNNWDIWAIDREGKNLSQITMDEARDGAPTVGSHGRIYFHSDRKISEDTKQARQAKGVIGKFHIWSIKVPMLETTD